MNVVMRRKTKLPLLGGKAATLRLEDGLVAIELPITARLKAPRAELTALEDVVDQMVAGESFAHWLDREKERRRAAEGREERLRPQGSRLCATWSHMRWYPKVTGTGVGGNSQDERAGDEASTAQGSLVASAAGRKRRLSSRPCGP